ncbi:MAG: alanine--tRNA ligase, partial [Actinobacteria bacterium]|nr:alanine--tRNA ligase [Actinomycetota bacterium]NIS32489.1 alanine--tRNA ligase [Actinomycetota bacterium]NIT96275.1 alanine--tRNA ligase [Actinomycetota bacterium]NIU19987.1 alanine--tRNA ligase [Actinomycetota bacterium]NIU67507.1 alanine--tRNA ligase [Actinomycetota bacterium]
ETLRTGQAILDAELTKLGEGEELAGETAFLLHDTYGFPLEVTQEITAERGVSVDEAGFRAAMAEQQRRAKDARKVVDGSDTGHLVALVEEHGETVFTGRDEDSSVGEVLYVDDAVVVLDRTPFYAESGGQIGDTGTIRTDTGVITVGDTRYGVPGLHLHDIESIQGEVTVGQSATATIDDERRAAIRRNHTGTHLLHAALRTVLGEHVKQQGSYVGPDRLRFDFSHYDALTPEQIAEVEDLVNSEVLANPSCRHYETTMDHAQEVGAIAFFGEKYGDVVRVLEAGPNSTELCGGTHVRALGDIGLLRIVSEGSIGSNIRRVEAVTGDSVVHLLRDATSTLDEAARLVGVPTGELVEGARARSAEVKRLQKELGRLKQQLAVGQAPALAAEAVGGVVVARVEGVDRGGLRDLAVSVRDQAGVEAVVLGAVLDGGGVALAAAVTPEGGHNAGR